MFKSYFNERVKRVECWEKLGLGQWQAVDFRPKIAKHWENHETWVTAPVLLKNFNSQDTLHLAEGHSRIGALKGLVNSKIIKPNSKHAIWLGTIDH